MVEFLDDLRGQFLRNGADVGHFEGDLFDLVIGEAAVDIRSDVRAQGDHQDRRFFSPAQFGFFFGPSYHSRKPARA